MLDTSLFNRVVDGAYAIDRLPRDAPFFITHIQRDELNATSNISRKMLLLETLGMLHPESLPTESGVVGVSRVGEFKASEAVTYEAIKAAMLKAQPQKDHTNDSLIAETAILNGYTLVTSDGNLGNIVESFGAKVLRVPNRANKPVQRTGAGARR